MGICLGVCCFCVCVVANALIMELEELRTMIKGGFQIN
jgi:hypothetical protein